MLKEYRLRVIYEVKSYLILIFEDIIFCQQTFNIGIVSLCFGAINKMKQVIIDGNNFSNEKEFYDEIERLLAPNHNWRIHEFNTFPDVLCGGFGFHDWHERLEIVWINAAKSRKDLG